MKEELQGKLVEILTSIQTAAGKASDFAMEQLPDIAQSYVAYGRAFTAVMAAIAVILFGIGFWGLGEVRRRVSEADKQFAKDLEAYETRPKHREYMSAPYRRQYFEAGDIMPLQFVPFILGTVVFGLNLPQMLLVWFAPKVWLLKEIAGLLK